MQEKSIKLHHPGIYVKKNVFPVGMTVKKAAEMMGIGRPALSNFLNGKANLSLNMASRLEKTFGADKAELLKLQQEYSAFQNKENESRIAVRSYAPSFLNIRATHIETWAEKIEARSSLPALLRCLVNTTGSEITHTDFPAYDNSQKHGWDGQVEAKNNTPWVPEGFSGWEFGCNEAPASKANKDYSTRTNKIPKSERKNTTFIFVTPRAWKQKDEWIKSKKEKNQWKDVRAYDANDLEQWLELSVPGQVWLTEKIGISRDGCQTLDEYWKFWSETASPTISTKIFNSAIASHSETIKNWYQNSAKNPLVITAGSKEEALAFIACASICVKELQTFAEQAVLVSIADTAKRLAKISTEFIPIAHTDSAETELIRSFKNRLSIVVTEKNIKGMEPDIIVDLPNYESFREALIEMGFDEAQIDIHSNRSGNSPTILRRQLATIPTFKNPGWAISLKRIQIMVPLVLAGTWKSDQDGDIEILNNLTEVDYSDIEKSVADLASLDDAPVWSEGKYRGVISKLDCFHTISDQITANDLDNFFFIAEYVLSEDDPALDLEKDKRWAANIYNKVRNHSDAIRKSICENLIILSVHGDGLFGKRLSFQVENRVAAIIRKLLENQKERMWQSQQNYLPKYAEAAPDVFLDIVEFELSQENPAFAPLFESVDKEMFSRCERTGMLWALELLAWEPTRLSRVAKVLAQLCAYKLEDNWSNKPMGSLQNIFLSRGPHTAATSIQRYNVLELLCKEYPDIGWKICMRQITLRSCTIFGTYRPHWRSDASGVSPKVIGQDVIEFRKKCQDLVLSWPKHSRSTLSDLIDCLSIMENKDRQLITTLITDWINSAPLDEDILLLREHVRTRTMTQGVRRRKKDNAVGYADGKKIYDLLEPKNINLKHQWLFSESWVEYTPDELELDDLNYEARDKKISEQRTVALNEILDVYDTDGVIKLCLNGDTGFTIGYHLGQDIMGIEAIQQFSIRCLSIQPTGNNLQIDKCLSGILHQFDDESRVAFINNLTEYIIKNDSGSEKLIRLFVNAPFTKITWDHLLTHDDEIIKKYWINVLPRWNSPSSEDLNYLVEQLMEANRPRAAFGMAHLKPDYIESTRLIKLLTEIATNLSEPEGHFQVSSYEIEQALKSLNQRKNIERIELVRLEYLYIQTLTPDSTYNIPNLSKEISESPLLFMQMLALYFRRDDGGEDPTEWRLPSKPEQRRNAANNAYSVLEYANVIPGSHDDSTIDVNQLRDWVLEVRRLAKENGRVDVADRKIGLILSKAKIGKDGIWPSEEVREIFEDIASTDISTGMEIGLRNSRGVEFRPDDGTPERKLAKKYGDYAKNVMNKFPFTGRMLMNIARSYKNDADWHDTNGSVKKWLRG